MYIVIAILVGEEIMMDGIYTKLPVASLLTAMVFQTGSMTFLTMNSKLIQTFAKDNHLQINTISNMD